MTQRASAEQTAPADGRDTLRPVVPARAGGGQPRPAEASPSDPVDAAKAGRLPGSFSEKWLATTCRLLPDVHSAVFMVPDRANNQLHLLAKWPRSLAQQQDFFATVKYALKRRGEVCLARAHTIDGVSMDYFAKPVFLRSRLVGVLAIKMKHLPASKHLAVYASIKRSICWLGLASFADAGSDEFYAGVVGMLASCFEQASYAQGLMRLVAELTSRFQCERVAFGELGRHHCSVVALSGSADFDRRSSLVRRIGDAMDEAVEQDSLIYFPDPEDRLIQRAHRELARKFGAGTIVTVPLAVDGEFLGAVTLLGSEEHTFDDNKLDQCRQTLALLAPFFALKREQERGPLAKLASSCRRGLAALLGARHLRVKLAGVAAAALLAFASLVETDFRVTADAVLEGEVQRVVAAPMAGYLLSASVRAGDTIRAGEVMASLDDRDLRLELAKLDGRLQKARREYREAQSSRDLVKVRVTREQINQIDAEIELLRRQLDSVRLTAPFDGVVIDGDLSQLLGSPVERGDTLFKVAPLAGYRIILKVDESEIAYVEPGQPGALTLTSLSRASLPLVVERITSVATAEDGANIFRVEASLPDAPGLLRPGMQGVGKIDAGRARLVWIWSRELLDWLSLRLWSWWP